MTFYNLNSGEYVLSISALDGTLQSMTFRGRELLKPSSEAFLLHFLDPQKERVAVSSKEFKAFRVEQVPNRLVCSFSEHPDYIGTKVEVSIIADGEGFRFRTSVFSVPEGFTLEMLDAPTVTIPAENDLFWPHCEGQIVCKHDKETWDAFHMKFPGSCEQCYPGLCQMQFLASYSMNAGVYFASEDYSHVTKLVSFHADGENRVRLQLEAFCGDGSDGRNYTQPYENVLRGFEGDWVDACLMYRDWAEKDPLLHRKVDTPQWLDESPVLLICPVRGDGDIKDEQNRFIPYENSYQTFMNLAEKLDSKIIPTLMRWDCFAPWGPPYYWPPVGGEESFLRLRDLLHESGHFIGVYGSGTFWMQKSFINGYSQEKQFEEENLIRFMTRGPKGELGSDVCKQIRESCGMCICTDWAKETMLEQIRKFAAAKIDFAQIFDQNMGCRSLLCYSSEHGHPSIPGAWQTKAMLDLIEEMTDVVRQSGYPMVLGTEAAPAAPYTAVLPLNDLRELGCAARNNSHVPACQFVFHHHNNNFLGNQVEAWQRIDCEKSPDNLQYRIAYGFNSGALLSLTLRDSGEIAWGAADDWSRPVPEQEPVITLVRNLNRVRREYPEFLFKGKMQKTRCRFNGDKYVLHMKDRDEVIPTPLHSAWTSPEGKHAEVVVNFQSSPMAVCPEIPEGVVVRTESGEILTNGSGYEIPSLAATVFFIENK